MVVSDRKIWPKVALPCQAHTKSRRKFVVVAEPSKRLGFILQYPQFFEKDVGSFVGNRTRSFLSLRIEELIQRVVVDVPEGDLAEISLSHSVPIEKGPDFGPNLGA